MLVVAWMTVVGFAQEATPPREEVKVFRLDYVLKELEGGKVINSRSYSTLLSSETASPQANRIRAGNKVPIPTGTAVGLQYQDVGVSIDSRFLKEAQNQLALNVVAEVSSVVTETSVGGAASVGTMTAPLIRQSQWGASIVVPLRKATLIFSSDDPTLKRQTQLELTATPIP
jgi:hypothetical protein